MERGVYLSEPVSNTVMLYSKGIASVSALSVLEPLSQIKRDTPQPQSKGILSGVFGGSPSIQTPLPVTTVAEYAGKGRHTTKSSSDTQSKIIVLDIPNDIEKQTVDLRIPNTAHVIDSWEVFNPDSILKSLELCVGRYVEIYDTDRSQGKTNHEPAKLAGGILQSINGNLIEVREQIYPQIQQTFYSEQSRQLLGVDRSTQQLVNALNLPLNFSVKTFDNIPWGLVSPYLVGSTIGPSDDLVGKGLELFYTTRGLSYVVSYSIIIDPVVKQLDLLCNATIRNDTNGKFPNSSIVLIEDVAKTQPNLQNYEKTRYGSVDQSAYVVQEQKRGSFFKTMSTTSARRSFAPSPSASSGDSEESFAFRSEIKSTQKVFPISTVVTIEANSEKSMTLSMKRLSGSLQYIHNVFESDEVFMSIFFDNPSQKNPKVGNPLPTGKASIYSKSGEAPRIVLGETWITPEHSQPHVRLNLNAASSISAKHTLTESGRDQTKAKKFEEHTLEYTNLSDIDVEILVRFTFNQPEWKTTGDINFTLWGPENEGEPFSETVGKGSVIVPANDNKIFKFTANYKV